MLSTDDSSRQITHFGFTESVTVKPRSMNALYTRTIFPRNKSAERVIRSREVREMLLEHPHFVGQPSLSPRFVTSLTKVLFFAWVGRSRATFRKDLATHRLRSSVLCYIQNVVTRYQMYVGNRVQQIHDLTDVNACNYIESKFRFISKSY